MASDKQRTNEGTKANTYLCRLRPCVGFGQIVLPVPVWCSLPVRLSVRPSVRPLPRQTCELGRVKASQPGCNRTDCMPVIHHRCQLFGSMARSFRSFHPSLFLPSCWPCFDCQDAKAGARASRFLSGSLSARSRRVSPRGKHNDWVAEKGWLAAGPLISQERWKKRSSDLSFLFPAFCCG